MLTDVMLCVGFVIAIGIMYLAVHKMASVMSEAFFDEEMQTQKTEQLKAVTEKKQEIYKAELKPRISLRSHPRSRDKKRNNVLVGNARPYSVNMKKV